MNIWLIHLGELLPIDGDYRLFRYGMLSQMLAASGHSAVQWAPTFSHITKHQRFQHDCRVQVSAGYDIELMHAAGYRRHVGWKRHRFHRRMADRFRGRSRQLPRPDIILCSMPTAEMCLAALEYGRARNVPVVIDVRDLWPDALVDGLSPPLRPLANLAFTGWRRRNERVFRLADAIVGVSPGFLQWGLHHARRAARPTDRVFPMAMRSDDGSRSGHSIAEQRWNARGLFRDDHFKLCFFGTFGRLFDMATVIAAARRLQNHRQLQFVLCGDGMTLSKCRQSAADLPNVYLPGWVDRQDVAVMTQWATAGLLPYHGDVQTTLPNKVADYLSAGLPVLVTGSGEASEFVERHECGVTYQAGDVDSLVQAVLNLARDAELRKRMSAAARRVFRAQLDAERVYPEMIDYLQQLAAGGWEESMQAAAA